MESWRKVDGWVTTIVDVFDGAATSDKMIVRGIVENNGKIVGKEERYCFKKDRTNKLILKYLVQHSKIISRM